MTSPISKKDVQKLNGTLAALSHFIARSAQHGLPFYKLLKKEVEFEWKTECKTILRCYGPRYRSHLFWLVQTRGKLNSSI